MLFRNLPSFSRLLKANVLVEEKVKEFCCGAQGVKIYWSEGMIISRGYPPTLLSSFSADDRTNYQEHDRCLRLGSDAPPWLGCQQSFRAIPAKPDNNADLVLLLV